MYEMTTEIPFTRTGADRKLKLHEAVGMMMDCCQFQEYQERNFRDYLQKNGIAVFLFSIQIDIVRMPEFRDVIKTAVKIYGCKSIYGLRRLTMRDADGELRLIANATGAFFDLRQGKALKLDPADFGVAYDPAEPMECLPRKIPVPPCPGTENRTFAVTRSTLDPNGHLTSAMYFAAAADALAPEYRFNRVRMEFKRQVKPGEIVTPVRFDAGNEVAVVDLRDADGNSCAMAEFSSVTNEYLATLR
jgi:acyl-ACP thioesterase